MLYRYFLMDEDYNVTWYKDKKQMKGDMVDSLMEYFSDWAFTENESAESLLEKEKEAIKQAKEDRQFYKVEKRIVKEVPYKETFNKFVRFLQEEELLEELEQQDDNIRRRLAKLEKEAEELGYILVLKIRNY